MLEFTQVDFNPDGNSEGCSGLYLDGYLVCWGKDYYAAEDCNHVLDGYVYGYVRAVGGKHKVDFWDGRGEKCKWISECWSRIPHFLSEVKQLIEAAS